MLITLLISKILIKILNIIGKGATSLPGKIALKLKPGILFRLSKGVYCICVTGTNGKTTTCALIEHGLKTNNVPYFINKSGANMISGVTTAFIKNSNIFGKPKCRYAVLECDENSLPIITNSINTKIIVVTNIFRDQLDRYAEVNTTFDKIKQGILNSPNATVVLNA
ncbi:MAG: Mur ligase family protein, partial [Clostridia bacterium]|nr:Mur ligase family protein [Clostridia bacterium]